MSNSLEVGQSSSFTPTILAEPPRVRVPVLLTVAATAMMIVAAAGLACSGYNFAVSFGDPNVDPRASQMMQEFQRASVGPVATGIHGGLVILNLFVIVCSIQLTRLRNWGLGMAAAGLSMLNVGSCCCVVGLPVGLFSLWVLFSPDVIAAFNLAHLEESMEAGQDAA